jgi:hypothetical protein
MWRNRAGGCSAGELLLLRSCWSVLLVLHANRKAAASEGCHCCCCMLLLLLLLLLRCLVWLGMPQPHRI